MGTRKPNKNTNEFIYTKVAYIFRYAGVKIFFKSYKKISSYPLDGNVPECKEVKAGRKALELVTWAQKEAEATRVSTGETWSNTTRKRY